MQLTLGDLFTIKTLVSEGYINSEIASADENGNYSDAEDNGEDGEGVKVNSVPLFAIGFSVAMAGLTVYSCSQDGWTSMSCIISGGLTVFPVGKLKGIIDELYRPGAKTGDIQATKNIINDLSNALNGK